MKIRNGFVSNSSSSSFIVEFDHLPKDAEELRVMLFGSREFFYDQYPESYKEKCHWSTQEIADIVFDDLNDQVDAVEIEDELSGGENYYEEWERNNPRPHWRDGGAYKAWSKAEREYYESMAKIDTEKFVKPNKLYFRFTYSDNEGQLGSAMEHGDLFENMKHKVISNH